jgi:hypothetical protein
VRRSLTRWIWPAVFVAALLLLPLTQAGAATTQKEFSGDKHVDISATDETGHDTGGGLYSGDVGAGDKISISDDNPDHHEVTRDVGTNSWTDNDVGPVRLVGGLYQHIPLDDFLRDYGPTTIPEIYVLGDSLYYTVDLIAWVQGSPLSFSYDDSFTVVSGECTDLPGFKIGTEPLTFSTAVGWINNSPYSGTVHVWGKQTTTETVPLLSRRAQVVLVLVVAGAALVLILRRRKVIRKPA